jgi:hypothetical protein
MSTSIRHWLQDPMTRVFPNSRALVLLLLLTRVPGVAQMSQPADRTLEVKHQQNTERIARYDIFEITLAHENKYRNAYEQAQVEVVFTPPSGKQVKVGCFLYGSAQPTKILKEEPQPGRVRYRYEPGKPNVWKARVAPWETGT